MDFGGPVGGSWGACSGHAEDIVVVVVVVIVVVVVGDGGDAGDDGGMMVR